jgi:predicted amidophosphoribosyltransferase
LRSEATSIIVVDDVLTSGAHFKAAKRMIQEKIPGAFVIGLFWARAVRPPIDWT